jgi:hypothetical protein
LGFLLLIFHQEFLNLPFQQKRCRFIRHMHKPRQQILNPFPLNACPADRQEFLFLSFNVQFHKQQILRKSIGIIIPDQSIFFHTITSAGTAVGAATDTADEIREDLAFLLPFM